MDRMACIDIRSLPLQLLLRQHPEWLNLPVAVLESDRPQGQVLWVNERARSCRILSGMSYAAALSLTGDLRAAVVSPEEAERAVSAIHRLLHEFSPGVEPGGVDEPGVFWLDASGLGALFESLRELRSAA